MSSTVRLTLMIAALIVGCSHPEVCQPQEAQQQGRAMALRGERLDPSLGGRCTDGAQRGVEAGYEQGRREVCVHEAAYREGFNVGSAGTAAGLPPRFRICADVAVLGQRFEAGIHDGRRKYCEAGVPAARQSGRRLGEAGGRITAAPLPPTCPQDLVKRAIEELELGHREGLERFCTSTAVEARGAADGAAGYPAVNVSAAYAVCPADVAKQIGQRYAAAYKAGLTKFCAAESAEAAGAADGAAGRNAGAVPPAYGRCEKKQVKRIGQRYAKGYTRGLATFCSADRLEAAAKKAAQGGASQPGLPTVFNVCVASFPGARKTYERAFVAERRQQVAAVCTYEAGVKAGAADASITNEKNLGMPAYCDRPTFARFQPGYLDGWKQAKAALCSQVQATNLGVEDGKAGRPLSYTPPPLCPPELHSRMLRAYRSGYRSSPPTYGDDGYDDDRDDGDRYDDDRYDDDRYDRDDDRRRRRDD